VCAGQGLCPSRRGDTIAGRKLKEKQGSRGVSKKLSRYLFIQKR
jgi:hypothetical protein